MRFTATISIATCALAVVSNGSLLGSLLGNINLEINACPQLYLDTSKNDAAKGRPVFQSSNPACPNYIPPEQLIAVDPVPASSSAPVPVSVPASVPASVSDTGNHSLPSSRPSTLLSNEQNTSMLITMPRPMSTLIPKAPSTTMHPAGAQSSSSVNGIQSSAPATWSKTVKETSSHQAASTAAAKPTATFDGRTKPAYAATNADWPGLFIIDPEAPGPGFSVSSATTSGGCTLSFPRPTGTTPGLPSYREIVPPPVFRGNSANDFIFPAVPMPKVKQFASQINTVVSVDIPEWPMGVVMETRNVGVFEFSS